MAWVTRIVEEEQIDYRLSEQTGCYVRGEETGVERADPQIDYRMSETDGVLRWIGSGLPDLGFTPGGRLDKDAARMLARGVHPHTRVRLVGQELRAHPRAKLPGAPLLDAIRAAAAQRGIP